MDTVTASKRSEMMSRVRCRYSKLEVKFRTELHRQGFRYRKNAAKYYGTPDLVLPKYRTVIFIDSCFWHGCERHCRMPSTRAEFWKAKIERNRERDKEVNRYYRKLSWRVIRIWEHDLKRSDFRFDYDMIKAGLVH